MGGWIDERERTGGRRMIGWLVGWVGSRVGGWVCEWMVGWVGVLVNGRTGGRVCGWIDGAREAGRSAKGDRIDGRRKKGGKGRKRQRKGVEGWEKRNKGGKVSVVTYRDCRRLREGNLASAYLEKDDVVFNFFYFYTDFSST